MLKRNLKQLNNYEKMIKSYGLELYDRDMDEILFAFINDGDFE